MSKPGLMYHFPNREALMLAIVDHAAARLEATMTQALGKALDEATPGERIRAYVETAAHGDASRAEWAAYVQAAYQPELAGPWADRMRPWFALPEGTDPHTRARLTAARLAADGLWAAEATGVFPPDLRDRDAVLAVLRTLTSDVVTEGETR